MPGRIAAFVTGCAVTGAVTFYFMKSDADARVAGMQQALDNLTYASKREELQHRKELAEMQAKLSGPPKVKPSDNWPPKGTRISRITGEGLLLETATGLTLVTWSEIPEEVRYSYQLQAKEEAARAPLTIAQRIEQAQREEASRQATAVVTNVPPVAAPALRSTNSPSAEGAKEPR